MGKDKKVTVAIMDNLSFDPQKTDDNEQIDLVLNLGDMLGQDEHSIMEKFKETMSTIIETHLIIEPNWAKVTKKAKSLEHIICRCDPPATAPSIVPGTGAVPGLYSHIVQSNDQDASNILKPFKITTTTTTTPSPTPSTRTVLRSQ